MLGRWLSALCLAGATCWLPSLPKAAAAPNVIVVLVDDLGWGDLTCYGSKFYRTPHIDRLAAEGMRFTAAYAACPVCSPTRAALMTGKYPARLHLTDWLPGRGDRPDQRLSRPAFRRELPLEEITLAEVLSAAGYATASIGKWHLGGEGFEPSRQGFGTVVAGNAAGSPLTYFAPYRKNGRSMPGLEAAPDGEYLTDRLVAEAESFIEQNRDRPFFLYLPHFAVHTPLTAKPELVDSYEDAKPHGRQHNAIYAAMIESVDTGLGRLLNKLDALQIADNTVIVFSSDNGGLATIEGNNTPATSNAPLREGKGYLYEGGIRVPLLVRWPGAVAADTLCEVPVSTIDLLPTIAELTGATPLPAVDGLSLLPLLRQTGEIERDALYWHYPHYSNQGGKPGGAIRRGDFKLIEFYENGRLELFNVQQDPGENNNLVERLPDQTRELSAALSAWRESVAAQMMTPHPEFVPNPQGKDGSITLPGSTADVHGIMLRYEPLPHKKTLGFWTRAEDWASWEFEVDRPGKFSVVAMQGCGPGSGGSQVDFSVAGQTLTMTVEATGGFQDFVEREIGIVVLDRVGRYTLNVKPRSKPGLAVMDLRQVRLRPVATDK